MEKPKIVIVEDEGIVALQIKTSLEQRGYTVTNIFASGEDTLANIGESKPDLVFMDMKLQGKLDGVQTAEELRARYHLPVIFLTAHSEDGTIERAKKAEPYGYILKPFDTQELSIAVEVAFYKHTMDREKEKLTKELRDALDKVKLLSGLLPICVCCKKIRGDTGYWTRIEEYIRDHSEAQFTHSLCTDCAKKFYPEYADVVIGKKWDKERRGSRRAADARWAAEIEDGGPCVLQNISEHGIGLITAYAIEIGKRFRISIHSPYGDLHHEAMGIWCRFTGSAVVDGTLQYAAGLSIVKTDRTTEAEVAAA